MKNGVCIPSSPQNADPDTLSNPDCHTVAKWDKNPYDRAEGG